MKGVRWAGARGIFLGLVLAVVSARPGVQAGSITASVDPQTVITGESARVAGYADAGKKVVVTPTGPKPPRAAQATAAVNRAFSVEIGPFEAAGAYALVITAEREGRPEKDRTVVFVDVIDPPPDAEESFENAYGQALAAAGRALQTTLDQVEQSLAPVPEGEPAMRRAREGMRRLRSSYLEIQQAIIEFNGHYGRLRAALSSEADLRPAVRVDLIQFEASQAALLRQRADSLLELGRSAASPWTDVCLGVAAARMVMDAQKLLLDPIASGLAEFLAQKAQVHLGTTVAQWLGRAFLNATPSALHPLSAQRERLYSGIKTGLDATLGLLTGGPWAAAGKILEGVVDIALDEFSRSHCLVFSGKMSGHTRVEALEGGTPFYRLDNDWEGDVDIMSAKPSGGEPVRFRGYLRGRGKNFTAVNGLITLFPKAMAQLKELTVNPGRLESLQAVFVAPLEGTIKGDEIVIKVNPGGLDFVDLVKSHMAMVVIPAASPVPIVQKYDIPYQGGNWQVSRAIGENRTTLQKITTEFPGSNQVVRKVKADLTRELSSAGARGSFRMKIDLCSGCER